MAEWRREDLFRLIEFYRERRFLWDPLLEEYKNRNRKHDSWRELDKLLGVEHGECEKKMRILVGQFQRECKKVTVTGKAVDESKWIYFKSLLFLKNKNRPRSTSDMEIVEKLESFEKAAEQVLIKHDLCLSNIYIDHT